MLFYEPYCTFFFNKALQISVQRTEGFCIHRWYVVIFAATFFSHVNRFFVQLTFRTWVLSLVIVVVLPFWYAFSVWIRKVFRLLTNPDIHYTMYNIFSLIKDNKAHSLSLLWGNMPKLCPKSPKHCRRHFIISLGPQFVLAIFNYDSSVKFPVLDPYPHHSIWTLVSHYHKISRHFVIIPR